MVTLDGIPLHPLVVHAVVVLLPLAALGALAVAARRSWLSRFGPLILLVAVVGVAAVPVATWSGGQLQDAMGGGSPLVQEHAARGEVLLPYAVAFVVLLAVAVLTGRWAERDEPARGASATVRRVSVASGVLAAVTGVAVTGLVIWIGHAGSTAVWQGVVG
jgi:hypothetical protein